MRPIVNVMPEYPSECCFYSRGSCVLYSEGECMIEHDSEECDRVITLNDAKIEYNQRQRGFTFLGGL